LKLLLVLAISFARPAQAFFDAPWITPSHPVVGETLSLNIHGGGCDVILEEPGYPQISQVGNAIRVVVYGAHYDFDDFCIFPVGTVAFPLPGQPAGAYTLQVDFAYDDFLIGPTISSVGSISFTVLGAQASTVPVPASSLIGRLALMLALGFAAWFWRAQERGSR
ncbi:MAG: hypothetical protein ACREPX_07685, partial [Rhodanobacteraceae bacterium]